jgi:hypothetical protein
MSSFEQGMVNRAQGAASQDISAGLNTEGSTRQTEYVARDDHEMRFDFKKDVEM